MTSSSFLRPRFSLASVLLVAAASSGLGVGATQLASRSNEVAAAPGQLAAKDRYQCPMHPTVVQDHPGDCPICGMKLVKIEPATAPLLEVAAGASLVSGRATVIIDPARQQLIGVRTAAVTRGTVGGAWRTLGRVAVDETRVKHVNVKMPAYVDRIFVDFVGKPVRRGQPLFSIFSPELFAAQDDLLLALHAQKTRSGNADALVTAARRKLQLWDVPDSEIQRIETTQEPIRSLTFFSPVAGVVTKKDVVEGMKLAAGDMPYEIVDLSHVWILADVYETELRHLDVGMAASLTLKAFPHRVFEGSVLFIDPLLDPKTRTVKVRLAFPNAGGDLKPQMFGDVILHGTQHEALRIPADAVIESGTMSVVFVSLGNGKLQPREVTIGDSDGTMVEVVAGVSEGEWVVTRANFLIDSESRLRASLETLEVGVPP